MAKSRAEREQFLSDLHEFFASHGLAIVPTYELEVTFHDSMVVVEYDAATQQYIQEQTIPDEAELRGDDDLEDFDVEEDEGNDGEPRRRDSLL